MRKPCQDRPLLQVGEHFPGPVNLILGHQLPAELEDSIDKVKASLDCVEGAGLNTSAWLVEVPAKDS